MSSWEYAFLFPQSPNQLRPAIAVQRLTEFGAECDGSIRLCVPIDDEGHLLDVGEEIALNAPFLSDLIRYLDMGRSLSIQLRSTVMAISVQFVLESPNPHISIGWSRRLFDESPPAIQSEFWMAIRGFAKECDAAYVVIVDDAPDHFEDRFREIDGKRVFDLQVNHRYGLSLKQIWLRKSLLSTLPEGPRYGPSEEIGDGFERHFIS